MSAHEEVIHQHTVEPGSDRSFGLIVGGILVAIGVYLYLTESTLHIYFVTIGGALMIAGLLLPRILHPLNIAWTKLGLLLGRIVTPIVMFVVYAITVVPIGLLLRLFGKDLLRLKRGVSQESYWLERTPPGPSAESLKDQF